MFLFQEIQLLRLRSQWSAMSAKAGELEGLQNQIRQYRPWFDDSFQSLSIMRQLTKAFPEDGAVTAKTVEIHEGNVVSCSGTARDNTALLRTLSQLRAADGVTDLKVDNIRGKSPMQFTFDFHWGKGGGNEN
jgi:Tfp pilus assembly protein PilN